MDRTKLFFMLVIFLGLLTAVIIGTICFGIGVALILLIKDKIQGKRIYVPKRAQSKLYNNRVKKKINSYLRFDDFDL